MLDPATMAMIAKMGSGVLSNLFGEDPTEDSMKYLNNISGNKKYFDPYIKAGSDSLPHLQEIFKQMLGDPSGLYSKLGAGYTESPGFTFKRDQALDAASRAAQAGGMAGSPMHEQNSMNLANNLSSQDYNAYMQQMLGMLGGGISGYQDLAHEGLTAGTSLSDLLAQMNAAKAKLSYEGAAQKNQNMGGLFGGGGAAIADWFNRPKG